MAIEGCTIQCHGVALEDRTTTQTSAGGPRADNSAAVDRPVQSLSAAALLWHQRSHAQHDYCGARNPGMYPAGAWRRHISAVSAAVTFCAAAITFPVAAVAFPAAAVIFPAVAVTAATATVADSSVPATADVDPDSDNIFRGVRCGGNCRFTLAPPSMPTAPRNVFWRPALQSIACHAVCVAPLHVSSGSLPQPLTLQHVLFAACCIFMTPATNTLRGPTDKSMACPLASVHDHRRVIIAQFPSLRQQLLEPACNMLRPAAARRLSRRRLKSRSS